MQHASSALRRRQVAVALTVPTLLLTCSLSSSAAGTASSRATAGVTTLANSPALHTYTPIAVGVPGVEVGWNDEGGAVDLYLPDGTVQVLDELKLGLIGEEDTIDGRFGSSVAVADLNGDKMHDLVVGSPGNGETKTPGRVSVLFGSATGITKQGALVLPSPAKAGDEFGAAVAVAKNGTVWVGAPGTDSGSLKNTGAVYRYAVSWSGEATLKGVSTEATLGAEGTLQANERFGEVLAPDTRGVLIGIPKKDIGSAKEAGQVVRLHQSEADAITAEVWNQNSPGVPGTAEAGDHFGAAVSAYGYAVGVPGEDIGKLKNAGAVQTFKYKTPLKPAFLQTQDTKGIPGAAEAGDKYGSAVTTGVVDCRETHLMAVGAPGEDIGKATNAGSVTLSHAPGEDPVDFPCASRILRQGKGLPGTAETGDQTGATLNTVEGDFTQDENQIDDLLIGSPGEDIGAGRAGKNTGRATIWSGGYTQSFGFQGGDQESLGYGSVLGSEH